jgi:copper(I)-binding protein
VAVIRSTSRSVLAGLLVLGGLAVAGCGAGQVAQTAETQPTIDGSNAQAGDIAIRNAALEYPIGGAYEKGSDARLRMVVVNQGVVADVLTAVRTTAAEDVTITQGPSSAATGSATPEPSVAASASSSGGATFSPSPTPSGTASGTPTGTAEPPSSSASAGTASASPGDTASAGATPSPSAAPTSTPNEPVAIPGNSYVSFTGDGPAVVLRGLGSALLPSQPLNVTLVFQRAGPVTMTIAVATPESGIPPAPTVAVVPDSESEG